MIIFIILQAMLDLKLPDYTSDIVNIEKEDPKSIGHSTTLMSDSKIYEEIITYLSMLCKEVSKDAKKRNMVGKTIQLVIKESNFTSKNKSVSLYDYTNEYETIFRTAIKLYEKNFQDIEIRLIGVTLQNLVDEKEINNQLTLFNQDEFEKKNEVPLLIDKFNKIFDKPIFKKASDILKKGD